MSIDRLENKSLSNYQTSAAPPEAHGKARRLIDAPTRTGSADGDDVATWIVEMAESAAGNEDGRMSEAPPTGSTAEAESNFRLNNGRFTSLDCWISIRRVFQIKSI